MKVLVTGAAGFIGSHLTEMLVEKGFDVKVLVKYNSRNNWGWLETSPIKNEIEVLTGDVRDYDMVYSATKNCKAVFHLAALIGIPYSYVSPMAYIRTNIEGTYNVLQAAKEFSLENILITSTSETYGTAQYVPIDENHPLVGQSPYSASKIGADQLAISYYRSFGLPVKLVRPFNTYGPRQSARAIIPTIISQALNNVESIKLGNTTPTRDLTFVKDTALGFYEIFRSDNLFGEVTNISMGEEISIGSLCNLIFELMDKKCIIETEKLRIRPDKSEVERLMGNNEKIIKTTEWKPQYDLKIGLLETIEWIKNNLNVFKTDIYNV
ncbi:NAD-dependent 4,6-dehydratase LegB [soil metagenome]